MGTAYQVPNLASYENHHVHHSAYSSALPNASRTRTSLSEAVFDPASRHSTLSQAQSQALPPSRTNSSSAQASLSRNSTGPSTPTNMNSTTTAAAGEELSRRDSAMVRHSLQIPTCISPKGGDLSEFVAQITCLFWCESIKTLEAAEKIHSIPSNAPVKKLSDLAIPHPSFVKWVHGVLSTTQVTQNVILLALMFIYRLKVANPTVKGRPGSEYRLMTVALMLGNKFLDDNTYTNKTWADVSGISVTEIHVMEVEFLSNMRYSLLASKKQWEEWLVKLAKFWEYCERATQAPIAPLAIPSPTHQAYTSPLPSPTSNLQLTPVASNGYPPVISSPLSSKPDLHNYRKRSFAEDDPTEPPAKRPARHAGLDTVRLPVPSLTLNTAHVATAHTASAYPSVSYAPQTQSALSLPPLVPGVRAMSTVYPTPASSNVASTVAPPMITYPAVTTVGYPPVNAASYAPHGPAAVAGGTPSRATSAITPTASFPPNMYGTPTKRTSPQSSLTPAAAFATSSPLGESFAHHLPSGVHTPISHSPSIYLQQRPSPYKPVRHVNTLLYPPPSAFLEQYHLSNALPPTQMHYQPLGRRDVYRSGIVPEFAMSSQGVFGAGTGRHHAVTPAPTQVLQQVMATQQQRGSTPQGHASVQGTVQYHHPPN